MVVVAAVVSVDRLAAVDNIAAASSVDKTVVEPLAEMTAWAPLVVIAVVKSGVAGRPVFDRLVVEIMARKPKAQELVGRWTNFWARHSSNVKFCVLLLVC